MSSIQFGVCLLDSSPSFRCVGQLLAWRRRARRRGLLGLLHLAHLPFKLCDPIEGTLIYDDAPAYFFASVRRRSVLASSRRGWRVRSSVVDGQNRNDGCSHTDRNGRNLPHQDAQNAGAPS
jgi:hypothetical protein